MIVVPPSWFLAAKELMKQLRNSQHEIRNKPK